MEGIEGKGGSGDMMDAKHVTEDEAGGMGGKRVFLKWDNEREVCLILMAHFLGTYGNRRKAVTLFREDMV